MQVLGEVAPPARKIQVCYSTPSRVRYGVSTLYYHVYYDIYAVTGVRFVVPAMAYPLYVILYTLLHVYFMSHTHA